MHASIRASIEQEVGGAPVKAGALRELVDAQSADNARWGTPMWDRLHRREWSKFSESANLGFINDLVRELPCGDCRNHAKRFVKNHLPLPLGDAHAMRRFCWHWHNEVNDRLHKRRMTFGLARWIYGWPSRITDLASFGVRGIVFRGSCPLGDAVCCTGALRDLHAAYGGKFVTACQTASADVWMHNPHVWTREVPQGFAEIHFNYTSVDWSIDFGFHFVDAVRWDMEASLGVEIPAMNRCGDLHLSDGERRTRPFDFRYWLVMTGGQGDTPTKWPNFDAIQGAVNRLGDTRFVQVGRVIDDLSGGRQYAMAPRLEGANVTDLVNRTNTRELISLAFHSDGVICGDTGLLHIAGALDKPAVCLKGGFMPDGFVNYARHQHFSPHGKLDCYGGGCGKRYLPGSPGAEPGSICVNVNCGMPACHNLYSAAGIASAVRRLEGSGRSAD